MTPVLWAFFVAAVSLGCTSTTDPVVDKLSTIEVAPPVDTAAEAGAVAVMQIEAMERVLGRSIAPIRITYVGRTQFGTPGEENLLVTSPEQIFDRGQWIVRAEGTFMTNRGRAPEPGFAGTGHFVIGTDGSVVEIGFP